MKLDALTLFNYTNYALEDSSLVHLYVYLKSDNIILKIIEYTMMIKIFYILYIFLVAKLFHEGPFVPTY